MKTEKEIRERLAKDEVQMKAYSSADPDTERSWHKGFCLALEERISLMKWILEEIR